MNDDLAPRPRPGFRSAREDPIDPNAWPQLMVAALGGGLGLLSLAAALLYLPPHMTTPILAGVSILMITRGAYGSWRVGASEPRVKKPARVATWGLAGGAVVVMILTGILGAGGLAPDWGQILGEPRRPAPAPTIEFAR